MENNERENPLGKIYDRISRTPNYLINAALTPIILGRALFEIFNRQKEKQEQDYEFESWSR